jgi:peptidoglycan hydrolase-like protein with peptidoglycan-binding domain
LVVVEDDVDTTVASVQRALKKLGYFSGTVDGYSGRTTRAAIRVFREENGLPASTGIDRELLHALGL